MKVYAAINSIQKELNKDGITKSHTNTHQNYKFRGIDDVYNALSPLLAKHGLCIFPRVLSRSMVERKSSAGGVLFSVVVEAEFDFVCSEDQSKHTVKMYGEAMDSGDKATNKALSAAYKYACLQTFAIPTEGDNDIDATTHEVKTITREPADIKSGRSPENSGFEVARFVPSKVEFVEGKGKGAGKTFSEIYRQDGAKFSGTEQGGQIAESAMTSKREIIVAFEKKGNYLNIKTNGVKMADSQPDPEPVIEEVPF